MASLVPYGKVLDGNTQSVEQILRRAANQGCGDPVDVLALDVFSVIVWCANTVSRMLFADHTVKHLIPAIADRLVPVKLSGRAGEDMAGGPDGGYQVMTLEYIICRKGG